MKKFHSKKGIFFSIDALIALSIIFLVIIIAYPNVQQKTIESKLDQDVLISLSSISAEDYNNTYIQSLISSGIITHPNNTLLEQIGEFYVTNPLIASQIAEEFLSSINTKENIGIWMENTLISSKNNTAIENAKQIDASRQIISGIISGQNITGYSSRAYLSSNLLQKYFYFGGYIGDGKLTSTIEYNGTIQKAKLEIACNTDFELYINNQYVGNYSKSPSDTTPIQHDLTTQISKFTSGINIIEFKASNLYIAGGFIKIDYQSEPITETKKYYFPGVQGLINIYDGLYIPDTISSMEIHLDLNSSFQAFLNIGNITVYNGSTVGRQTINIPNSILSPKLNYAQMANKTIPIRLGLKNVSLIMNSSKVDVISVTDLSGSMEDNCPIGYQSNLSISPCKINDAKNANNQLIDRVLNYSGNRVGLAGFQYYAKKLKAHPLSTNTSSLKNTITNQWNAAEWTCTCCGILKAISCYDPIIFKDNFNNQQAGTNPIGWAITETGGTIDISSQSLESNRSVEIIRTTNNPSMSHYFAPQQDAISIEFLIKHVSNNGVARIEIEGTDQWFAGFNDYIIIKLGNGWIKNNNVNIIPYNLGQTYKLKIEIVPNANTYNFYVDEILQGNNLPVVSTRNNVARVLFTTETAPINYQIDSLKIFLTQPICDTTNSQYQNNLREIILMGDGGANKACGLDPVPDWDNDGNIVNDAVDHAIQAACDAKSKNNITVHAIAFDVIPGGPPEQMLQQIASCGNGQFYSSNVTQITQVYEQVTQNILAKYSAQTLNMTNIQQSQLYSNSYISLNYQNPTTPFGISITSEQLFSNSTSVNFTIPQNSTVLSATAISYSGALWTSNVKLNNNVIYNINNYGTNYTDLGDPYAINLPLQSILPNNNLNLITASSSSINNTGSINNKIIYTVIKNVSAYSPISAINSGCIWNIHFEDNTNITLNVPQNYLGNSNCIYSPLTISYNINDALQSATHNLFYQIDLDHDGRLDFLFNSESVTIATSEVTGIPFPWSTEAQIRRWS